MTDPRLRFLSDAGYYVVLPRGTDWWVGLYPFLFTTAIVSGPLVTAERGYEQRWCFAPRELALPALLEWATRDFEGEPYGWVRATHDRRHCAHGDRTFAELTW